MTALDALRFRILMTLAMRAITIRDAIYLRNLERRSQSPLPPPDKRLQPLTIPCGPHTLEALNLAPPQPQAAILICHGIGEHLIYWQNVQLLLAQHSIASLIFHYSGYGRSTGGITPPQLRQNTQSAYASLQSLVPATTPIFLLGFSMGSAVAADAAPHLTPSPHGLILCEAFTTLREAAARIASPRLNRLLPDVWRTVDTLRTLAQPLLIAHSDADELFPTQMARDLHAAALTQPHHPANLVITPNHSHNQPFWRPTLAYWQPIFDFIKLNSPAVSAQTLHSHSIKD